MNKQLLNELPEFEFIQSLRRPHSLEVEIGIGDDAAVLNNPKATVIAQDVLVEGVHFKREWSKNFEWVSKAFGANIKDIEAMGTRARWALLSLGIPEGIDKAQLAQKIGEECEYWNIDLIGGDTVASPTLFIQLTLLGERPNTLLLRSQAKPGDKIWVSGELGHSHIGWRALEAQSTGFESQIKAHLIGPRDINEGEFAVKMGAQAGLDTSDSLADTLYLLARSSHVDLHLIEEKIPKPLLTLAELDRLGFIKGWIWDAAEDHRIIVTAPPYCNLSPWVEIGLVKQGVGNVYFKENDTAKESQKLPLSGYRHFREC